MKLLIDLIYLTFIYESCSCFSQDYFGVLILRDNMYIELLSLLTKDPAQVLLICL